MLIGRFLKMKAVSFLGVVAFAALSAFNPVDKNHALAEELEGTTKLVLSEEVFIRHSKNWSVVPSEFRNATQLISTGTRVGVTAPFARTLITSEHLKNHAAAIGRLTDIAAEVAATPEYRLIGGWPALERHYAAPIAESGQRSKKPAEQLRARVTTVTTAIAVAQVLVRFETVLLQETETATDRELHDRILGEAITTGRSAVTSKQSTPQEEEKHVWLLQAGQRAGPAVQLTEKGALVESSESNSILHHRPAAVPLIFGSLEIAASKNGQHVIIAGNSGYAVSHDFGKTYGKRHPIPLPFKSMGDPTIARGRSSAFYTGYIGLPDGTVSSRNISGCSISISKSLNNGSDFKFLGHAAFCPRSGQHLCFPDQGHLAADLFNPGARGADQLYLVYRHCRGDPTQPPITCEDTLKWCRGQPSLVCSKDGGVTWGPPRQIKDPGSLLTKDLLVENSGAADFPRVTVARNGMVYVIFRNGNLLQLAKFSSCSSGLERLGETITIPVANRRDCEDEKLIDKCFCPFAGLDRCNNGNLLSSPTIGVDDENPSRIYVAYSLNTSVGKNDTPANDDIVVQMSTDGGVTWPHRAIVSHSQPGRRFMPWLCFQNERAYVTWFDRRAATPKDNDLTDFYMGSAHLRRGALRAGPQINLSGIPDPQCGPAGSNPPLNWPKAPRIKEDAATCSRQPQLAGVCLRVGKRCDLKCDPATQTCPHACPSDDICDLGDGEPNYGDYNGNFCAAGRVFAAWPSATTPRGLSAPSVSAIRIYSAIIRQRGLLPPYAIKRKQR
jgi:hypothetical protein